MGARRPTADSVLLPSSLDDFRQVMASRGKASAAVYTVDGATSADDVEDDIAPLPITMSAERLASNQLNSNVEVRRYAVIILSAICIIQAWASVERLGNVLYLV